MRHASLNHDALNCTAGSRASDGEHMCRTHSTNKVWNAASVKFGDHQFKLSCFIYWATLHIKYFTGKKKKATERDDLVPKIII